MLCPICAAGLPADAAVCPACGTDLTDYLTAKYQPDLLFNEALRCLQREDPAAAAALLCRAAGLRPDDAGILRLWVRSEYLCGNRKRAVELMTDLIELDTSEECMAVFNALVEEYDREQAESEAGIRRRLAAHEDRLEHLLDRLERTVNAAPAAPAAPPPPAAPAGTPPDYPDMDAMMRMFPGM